jgi:hypothetical protein
MHSGALTTLRDDGAAVTSVARLIDNTLDRVDRP